MKCRGVQKKHATAFLCLWTESAPYVHYESIQTAGMIVSTDAIKKVDAMLVRQLQIGEYDG